MRRRIWLFALLAAACLLMHPDRVSAANPSVESITASTVAEIGRTRVVAFNVDRAARGDERLAVEVADPDLLEVLGPASLSPGSTIGYVRVRGLTAGSTSLTIGDAAIPIEIVEPRPTAFEARFEPRIIGPSNGAAVWGSIAVGVEVRLHPSRALRRLAIELPDGRRLEPVEDSASRYLPYRQLLFELDTAPIEAGSLELRPIAVDDAGREQAGPSVHLRVVGPRPAAIVAGEAEMRYEVTRPERFRDERLTIGNHRDASGGRFFGNASPQPAFCFPVSVASPGSYQVMLTAGGTRAQGVPPTVGVVVDGSNVSTTNGRLLAESWHREAIGVPFPLEAGDHVITPLFINDFFVAGVADRNLHIDRIEVARVSQAMDHGSGDAVPGMSMSMAGGMMGGAAATGELVIDDPYGTAAVPLRIGLVRPLDQGVLPGLLEVEGRCWWDGVDRRPAPVVTLLVNDEPTATQRSGAPRFWVDASCFRPGTNTIQLTARLDSGAIASTPVQTLVWPIDEASLRDRVPRRHHRYSIHEAAWDDGIADRLQAQHHPKERRAASFASNGSASLELPADLHGTFDVFIELRGDQFEGAPIAAVRLRVGDETRELGTVEAPRWWDTRRVVEDADIPPGPKHVVVSFENDRFERGVGDRNLWLQAVILAQKPTAADRTVPAVTITYPPEGHETFLVDALVAEATDDSSLASAELEIDGIRSGLTTNLNARPGTFVFPLLLRALEPGDHTVAIRARDVAGNTAISEPRRIVVLAQAPDELGTYRRAVRLLNRFAHGPAPQDLAAILTRGERAWLEGQLGASYDDPGDLAAVGAALPLFVGQNPYEVSHRAVSHLLLTPHPARARFVLWVQNHFSTWIRKTDGNRKWAEHVAFSRLGAAPFDHLLLASAESPAMLAYLDQESSYAGRLNENYAREVMELHTLGVDGGYTQQDVTNLAALLTGWTAALEGDGVGGGPAARVYSHRFDPRLNDGRAFEIVGMSFDEAAPSERYDRTRMALELLAAHPSTARFVSRKLAEHYVGVPAPQPLVDDLTAIFLETGGDTGAMLMAIAEHPRFWDADAPARIASSLDYAVRLCRVTGHFQPWQVGEFLDRSGQGLFDRPSPDGYPEEDRFSSDSNALIQRWQLARRMQWQLAGLVPGSWRHNPAMGPADWSQQVIDVIAVRLTGDVLGETSDEAARQLLESTTGTPDERIRLLAPFIAQLPEANMK